MKNSRFTYANFNLLRGLSLNCPDTPHPGNDCIMLRHVRKCGRYY